MDYFADLVLGSDLRLPGGTTASMAEEIRCQARAGYRTALLHKASRLVAGDRPFAPAMLRAIREGAAEHLVDPRGVRTRLLLLRHPTVYEDLSSDLPRLEAERVVLVANQAAVDGDGTVNYAPWRVHESVTDWLGVEPLWAPIGPLARDSLLRTAPDLPVRSDDWLNIMEIGRWGGPRTGLLGPVPIIGRHSRPQAAKWPTTEADLLAAYPDSADVHVKVLGGARPVADVIGKVPQRWHVEPFGARHPREFLAEVDFWVYFHAPGLREAYGRAIMEALAAGAVVVLPRHFERVFGDAALYTDPAGVLPLVRSLHADPGSYLRQSRRGQAFVERHTPDVHVNRLEQLIGPPAAGRAVVTLPHEQPTPTVGRRATPPHREGRPRVLFVTSNGAGMGHLTRLLATARRLDDEAQPVFLSLSSAVPVVEEECYPWEYCPSRGALGTSTKAWNRLFAARFRETLTTFRPQAVVFDGTWPYSGLVASRASFPEVKFIWSRRAMWKASVPPDQLEKTVFFDAVIEPGEFAHEFDCGATTRTDDAVKVAPIILLDEDELLPRHEAAARLGLDPCRPAMLVTLGAGNINDTSSELGAIVQAMTKFPDWQVCLTRPPIAERQQKLPEGVHQIGVYPLARYARAFDTAVSAAGYNSYHELIAYGIPTAFVPNTETVTDDQLARARFAQHAGVGICLTDVAASFSSACPELLEPSSRRMMRDASRSRYPGNGAQAAADIIRDAIGLRRSRG